MSGISIEAKGNVVANILNIMYFKWLKIFSGLAVMCSFQDTISCFIDL